MEKEQGKEGGRTREGIRERQKKREPRDSVDRGKGVGSKKKNKGE